MDTHARSVVKAISWRVMATLVTGTLTFLFTGSLLIAMGVGSSEAVSKIFLYWAHERLWDRIRWGRMFHISSP